MTKLPLVSGLLGLGILSSAVSAASNAVIDWNIFTVQAISTAARPGPTGFLDIATVHAAMYDAVEAIDGQFRLYHLVSPGAHGSMAAAAATAAHDILVNRFPSQSASLDAEYHEYLSSNGLSENDPGVGVGQRAAAAIITLRANDGSFPNPEPPPFTGGTAPYEWRPTVSYLPGPPPSLAPMETPWMATVTPFTLNSPSQFRADPPPSLTSSRYTQAYKEIKALGAFSGSLRTPEQTDLAYFWAANYLAVWSQVLRELANANALDIGASARLFALAYMAMADAGITAWDTKRHYVTWRPITAIQEGDADGNPRTVADLNWQPLLNTPNYPDYTSGANNVTGAVTRMLQLFFKTHEMTFSVTTTNPLALQQTRTYSRFADAADDVVNARIYEGIHFRFSDTVARSQGREIAKWAYKHFLRPVNDRDDDDNDGDN